MKDIIEERGCGLPTIGGLYLEIETGPNGIPLELFLKDPTIPVSPEFLQSVSTQGMGLFDLGRKDDEGNVVMDIVDWIGENNYPNVFDWIMEIMHMGFHQKIESTFPFKNISPKTMYFAIHRKAHIVDPSSYKKNFIQTDLLTRCKKKHQPNDTCIHYLTNDLVGGSPMGDREVNIDCPSFYYQGYSAPEDANPTYKPAIFIGLPVGQMAKFKFYTDGSEEISLRQEDISVRLPSFMEMKVVEVSNDAN